jgi:formamidopyrimidine-DNA glycosylase
VGEVSIPHLEFSISSISIGGVLLAVNVGQKHLLGVSHMPELPEMEIYRMLLTDEFMGKQITGVEINREKSINMPVPVFTAKIQGNSTMGIHRRAKFLIFDLNSGNHLLLHLMLGGWMFIGDERLRPERTKQVILIFGNRRLYFIGLRLGYLHLVSTDELHAKLSKLGPEPFDPSFHFKEFQERLRKKRGTLKSILVDPKFIAGIGNCYSDEICFEAKLRTMKRADDLTDGQALDLFNAIKPVLTRGIRYGGYMDNPAFAGDEKTGGYNDHFLVYESENQPCRRCGTKIEKIVISQRKSFFCPGCQV